MNSRIIRIEKSKEFFDNRDKADAAQLYQDVLSGIKAASSQKAKRLWILTNVNGRVLLWTENKLDYAALKKIDLEVKLYNLNKTEEMKLRWKAVQEPIPTLVIDVIIESKIVYVSN